MWIVVNTKFLIIRLFYHKIDALALAKTLQELEGDEITHTIIVKRDAQ